MLSSKSSIDSPWIGTFHSIFAKFLRKHSGLVNLKSNFTILDIEDQEKIIKTSFRLLQD